MGWLDTILGVGQTALGSLAGIENLRQAQELQRRIRGDLAKPPLGLSTATARGRAESYLGDPGNTMSYVGPAQLGGLMEGPGGQALGLNFAEFNRTQGLQDKYFGESLGALQGMETDPWSEKAQLGMAGKAGEAVNRAGMAALSGLDRQHSRGMGRGRYALSKRAGVGREAASARTGALRDLETTRSTIGNQNRMMQSQGISNLWAGRPIQAFDWASQTAPQMNWPLQKANVEIGVGAMPLQIGSDLASGWMGAGGQINAARAMPTPQAPNPWAGVVGSIPGMVPDMVSAFMQ